MIMFLVQTLRARTDAPGQKPEGRTGAPKGFMHVVLEINAPVYQAAETYEANGRISCDWGVDDITQGCSDLTFEGGNFEHADLLNGFGNSPDAA